MRQSTNATLETAATRFWVVYGGVDLENVLQDLVSWWRFNFGAKIRLKRTQFESIPIYHRSPLFVPLVFLCFRGLYSLLSKRIFRATSVLMVWKKPQQTYLAFHSCNDIACSRFLSDCSVGVQYNTSTD